MGSAAALLVRAASAAFFPLQDLSLCLEEEQWSPMSWLSGCSMAGGEHFPQRDDFLLLVESGTLGDKAPEFLLLVL